MTKQVTLQEPYLNALRIDQTDVNIFLANGIKLQGKIEAFDAYCLLLKNTITQLVYKHSISTVVPAQNVDLSSLPLEEINTP